MDGKHLVPGSTHILPIPCKNKEVYSELNTLIYEYLEVNGLEHALSTFTKECLSKNLPCPKLPSTNREVKAAFTHYDGDQLLKSYDEGDLETFLKLWKQFQNHIQVTSEDMKKLEVYLRVHFAIYPKSQNQPEAKQNQAMQSLKTFFEENSASLSSDAAILPLFALPFVPDPRPHPIFKDLFHESWTSKLRAQLETTVNKYFELLQENITNHCKLASVVVKGSKPTPMATITTTSVGQVSTTTTKSRSPVRKPSVTKSNTVTNNASNTSTVTIASETGGDTASLNRQATIKSPSGTELATATEIPSGKSEETPENLAQLSENAVFYHQERFLYLLGIHRKTRKVLRGVRENYSKLLKVSSILITALERSLAVTSNQAATSSPSNLDLILQQCLLIYPEIFTNPSKEASPTSSKPDLDHFKQLAAASSSTSTIASSNFEDIAETNEENLSATAPEASDVSLLFLGLPDISLETLHYSKIKDDLISEKLPATNRLCLLQALRWLITKTLPASRASVIDSFTENDLLGIKPSSSIKTQNYSQKLFSCFLSPTPTYQKESLARLVNAFACTWKGRDYLTSTNYIIDILIRSLVTFKTQEESFICHMVIATLQKLSLRRNMRLFMIDRLVIPWLVKYIKTELERDQIRSEVNQALKLHSKDGIAAAADSNNGNTDNITESNYGDTTCNTYLMEYAWALLMNLALHPESIKSALTVDFEFLHSIVTMLTSRASFEFAPYVLSTLFSLLRNPNFFDKAKSMDLKRKLNPVIAYQSPDIQCHLSYLLTQLYEKPNADRLTATGETEYDDTDNPDPEDVENELELQESWMVNQTMNEQMLTGDDLLIREYLIPKAMPLYVPPGGNGPQAANGTTTDQTPHTSLSSHNNSVDSSFHSNKSSRENSSETPPSNQNDSTSPGIILRPTTPVHTKPPRVARLDDQTMKRDLKNQGSKKGDRSKHLSPSPPPPQLSSSKTPQTYSKQQNPFLQQFNSMRTNTISHLIHHQSSSEQQDGDKEEIIKTLASQIREDEQCDSPLPPLHATDSEVTGKFSLHESPIMTFSDNPFVDTNLNKITSPKF